MFSFVKEYCLKESFTHDKFPNDGPSELQIWLELLPDCQLVSVGCVRSVHSPELVTLGCSTSGSIISKHYIRHKEWLSENVLSDQSARKGFHLFHTFPLSFVDNLFVLCDLLVFKSWEISFSTWFQIIFVLYVHFGSSLH